MVLASLTDLKTYLGITSTADDALLSRLVSASSDWFERQTGQAFTTSSLTEVRSGNGGTAIVPYGQPVVSFQSVTVNDSAITVASGSTDSGYVVLDGLVRLRGGQVFTRGVGNVTLAYTAGYLVIPADVQQAVIEYAAFLYQQRTRIGLTSKSIPTGESFSYQALSVPIGVSTVVEAYRRLPRFL